MTPVPLATMAAIPMYQDAAACPFAGTRSFEFLPTFPAKEASEPSGQ